MFGSVLAALLPIALLIALGQALFRAGFLPAVFWAHAERLGYFVLLPSLFFHALATADLGGAPAAGLAAALLASILAVAGLALLPQRRLAFEGPVLTSVFQGGVRFNNYVGVTAALTLFGPTVLGLAAIANATIVPTVNVLSILVFSRYTEARPDLGGVLKRIALNPLVLSCVGGLAFRGAGLALPVGLDGALEALGRAALPLGLLCVGAALEGATLRRGVAPVLTASILKFVAMPAATAAACLLLGLRGDAAMVALLFQCLPTASSSYVLARQLGGDAPLMAGVITVQTALALLTMPVTLALAAPIFAAAP